MIEDLQSTKAGHPMRWAAPSALEVLTEPIGRPEWAQSSLFCRPRVNGGFASRPEFEPPET
jgi:hypothetical protein